MRRAESQSARHTIRLGGPWTYCPLARRVDSSDAPRGEGGPAAGSLTTVNLPASGRAQLPGDWSASLGADFQGRVRYLRNFNWPARLEPGERVELVIAALVGSATVTLNDQPLGACQTTSTPWRTEVTRLLAPRNQLEITLEFPGADDSNPTVAPAVVGGLTGEIRLEISTLEESAG